MNGKGKDEEKKKAEAVKIEKKAERRKSVPVKSEENGKKEEKKAEAVKIEEKAERRKSVPVKSEENGKKEEKKAEAVKIEEKAERRKSVLVKSEENGKKEEKKAEAVKIEEKAERRKSVLVKSEENWKKEEKKAEAVKIEEKVERRKSVPVKSKENAERRKSVPVKSRENREEKEEEEKQAEVKSQENREEEVAQSQEKDKEPVTEVQEKNNQILVLGLDGAGKTSILQSLASNKVQHSLAPTLGSKAVCINAEDRQLEFLEIGGSEPFRSSWEMHLSKAWLLIFVVDSANHSRLPEAKKYLHQLIKPNPALPLVVFANKQDLESAYHITDIHEALALSEVGNNRKMFLFGTQVTENDSELPSTMQDAKDLIVHLATTLR